MKTAVEEWMDGVLAGDPALACEVAERVRRMERQQRAARRSGRLWVLSEPGREGGERLFRCGRRRRKGDG